MHYIMNLRRTLLLLALLALLPVSCTDDLGVAVRPSGREIGLSPLRDVAVKGGALAAFPADAAIRLGAVLSVDGQAPDAWFTDVPFAKDGDSWKASPAKYWPTAGTLSFLGWWTPSLSVTASWGGPSSQNLVLTVPANDTAQDDLLAGWASGLSSQDGPFTLPMRHLMAQVVFAAACEENYAAATNSGITVKGIEIIGAADAGRCTVTPSAVTPVTWSNLGAAADRTVKNLSATVLTTAQRPLGAGYLLPGQAARGFRIRYTIHNGHDASGADQDNDCVYIYEQPSGAAAWAAGRRYLYELTFSLDGISVAPSVTEWRDAPEVSVDVQGVPDETLDYLRMEVESDGRVTWSCSDAAAAKTVEYSVNGAAWQQLTATVEGVSIIVHEGDVVKLRGSNQTYCEMVAGTAAYNRFGTEDGAMFSLKGNAMSLIDPVGFEDLTALPANTKNNFRMMFYECSGVTGAGDMTLPATTLRDSCYVGMFRGCPMLTDAPALPATSLRPYCYCRMFQDCSGLVEAPVLRAMNATTAVYRYMFSGCISLAAAPDLPATTVGAYCYSHMFDGCVSLSSVPDDLPATTIANYCYEYMFYGCAALRRCPRLPAMAAKQYCYRYMLADCVSLETAPELPATTMAAYCYQYMMSNCTAITAPPALPAQSLANYCYSHMFHGCTGLLTAPVLPAMTLKPYCYEYMFRGCTALAACPTLPATSTTDGVYRYMFYGCTSITETPDLPALVVAYYAYYYMFAECTALVNAHDLNATDVCGQAYTAMFLNCTALVTAPEIAATTLRKQTSSGSAFSYHMSSMFNGCTALVTPPSRLRPEEGRGYSYYRMFYNCPRLATAPQVDLTSFTGNYTCYEMFRGCSALVEGPVLKAKTLRDYSYYLMFYNCGALRRVTCLAEDISAFRCQYNWLGACKNIAACTFVQPQAMEDAGGEGTTIYPRTVHGIPSNWTIVRYTE